MRMVHLDLATVGERLATDLRDSAGRLLLAAGAVLTARLVERLTERGYLSAAVIDPLAPEVRAPQLVGEQTRFAVISALDDCLQAVADTGRVVVGRDLWRALDEVRASIAQCGTLALHLGALHRLGQESLVHAANVCVYSVLAGATLGLDPVDIRYLALGALLRDIGHIHYKNLADERRTLSPEEAALLRRHAADGYELLRRQQDVDLRCAHVAFQHHERCDGSGYPRGLHAAQIHPFARIVAVADLYERLTATRGPGAVQPPHAALRELRATAALGQLDAAVVSALTARLAAFPEGTLVRLRSGELAVVVAQTARGAQAPRIRVVADASLRPVARPDERQVEQGLPDAEIDAVLDEYPAELRQQLLAG